LQHLGFEHHRLNDFPTHLFTMWISALAIAELVVHYIVLAYQSIAERQREADEAKARALRSEHLASLMTLPAGAAHELSTPLGTIALAARELGRASSRQPGAADFKGGRQADPDRGRSLPGHPRKDERPCRQWHPGCPATRDAGELAHLAASGLTDTQRRRLQIHVADELSQHSTSAEAADAVSSLLKNAFDASTDESPVVLRVRTRASLIRIEVHDRGCGMSDEVLRRAGEPFCTPKEAGRGLGLGVFLARTFAERAGGMLWFERSGGTIAILEIPGTSEAAVA
jgi:two-component system sensor histidine kinase RegB